MILSCFNCRDNQGRGAQYQDEKYGKGMRVHNKQAKAGNAVSYCCTVCLNERTAGDQR